MSLYVFQGADGAVVELEFDFGCCPVGIGDLLEHEGRLLTRLATVPEGFVEPNARGPSQQLPAGPDGKLQTPANRREQREAAARAGLKVL